jgi:hypothetical protein
MVISTKVIYSQCMVISTKVIYCDLSAWSFQQRLYTVISVHGHFNKGYIFWSQCMVISTKVIYCDLSAWSFQQRLYTLSAWSFQQRLYTLSAWSFQQRLYTVISVHSYFAKYCTVYKLTYSKKEWLFTYHSQFFQNISFAHGTCSVFN